MRYILFQLIISFLGSMGFAMMFGMRRQHILAASLGGMLSWGVYLCIHGLVPGIFIPNLAAAVFSSAYADFLAHLRKCPATLFLITAIIPLVPGSSLYYAMEASVKSDYGLATSFGHTTLICTLAISAGISIASVIKQLCSLN